MFGENLFDITFTIPDRDTHIFVCLDNDDLVMIGEGAEDFILQLSEICIAFDFLVLLLLCYKLLIERTYG
jgi:hypothetical protein